MPNVPYFVYVCPESHQLPPFVNRDHPLLFGEFHNIGSANLAGLICSRGQGVEQGEEACNGQLLTTR